jgi:hypothetical protein
MADPTYKKGTPEHTTNHVRKEHPSRRQEMPKRAFKGFQTKKKRYEAHELQTLTYIRWREEGSMSTSKVAQSTNKMVLGIPTLRANLIHICITTTK